MHIYRITHSHTQRLNHPNRLTQTKTDICIHTHKPHTCIVSHIYIEHTHIHSHTHTGAYLLTCIDSQDTFTQIPRDIQIHI